MLSKVPKLFGFLNEALQDMFFVVRFNNFSPFEDRNRRLFYRIVILTHAIEKGLSLENPRSLFGRKKIEMLIRMIQMYEKSFSVFPLEMALGAFRDYVEVHRKMKLEGPFLDEIDEFISDPKIFGDIEPKGGVKRNINEFKERTENIVTFLSTRYSCRMFKKEVMPKDLVRDVIAAARWAPSQCNRQSVRVHCFQDNTQIKELLFLQSGAAGFGEGIHNLFVVTYEAPAWAGSGQRNQGYIDGGLFSQQLLLVFHAYRLGACALNLAVGNAVERKIKKVAGIPFRERLIMMIAFGFCDKTDLKVACSPRLPVDEILAFR